MGNTYVEAPDECPWCDAEPFEYEDGKLKIGYETAQSLGVDPYADGPNIRAIDEDRLRETDEGHKVKVPCPECGHPLVVVGGMSER